MINILTNADRDTRLNEFDAMFRARAAIFRDRLGWAVSVHQGWETDRYDQEEDPVYIVSVDAERRPTGSLRILPTTGETMLRNEFANFFDEPVDVHSPTVWECTRFCVHPRVQGGDVDDVRVSSELLIGLCKLCLTSGIEQIVGLYDHAMARVYRRIGWSPAPLAHSRPEVGRLIVGIWDVSDVALEAMIHREARGTASAKSLPHPTAPEPAPLSLLAPGGRISDESSVRSDGQVRPARHGLNNIAAAFSECGGELPRPAAVDVTP